MLLFALGDQAALSGTGIGLLLRLGFWRMCQTLDEDGRAHALLVSWFAGGRADLSVCSSGKQLMVCSQQEGPGRGRGKERTLQKQELQFCLGFS